MYVGPNIGGDTKLRMAVNKAGPVVTDNGNLLLDADFGQVAPNDVQDLNIRITLLPGVLETGQLIHTYNNYIVSLLLSYTT